MEPDVPIEDRYIPGHDEEAVYRARIRRGVFGMYTQAGNGAVAAIVDDLRAQLRAGVSPRAVVMLAIEKRDMLSLIPDYADAADSEVRCHVSQALDDVVKGAGELHALLCFRRPPHSAREIAERSRRLAEVLDVASATVGTALQLSEEWLEVHDREVDALDDRNLDAALSAMHVRLAPLTDHLDALEAQFDSDERQMFVELSDYVSTGRMLVSTWRQFKRTV